ncbi:MAG: DUF2147 domain-containing protein [Paracoccaceae bacterium]
MKNLALAAILALGTATGAMAADPLEGLWRTTKDDNGNSGLIEVKPCGAKLCGTLIKSFDASGASVSSKQIGRKIISETVASGGGSYKGKVYSPDRDKTYNSKLALSGNTLKVSGCVLGICRDGGTWSRQ